MSTAPLLQSKKIDLLRGHPSTSLLATDAIADAAATVLNSPVGGDLLPNDSYADDRHPLHYGPDLGNWNLREEIGKWVAGKYGMEEEAEGGAERINVTPGASYGLMNTLLQCTSPGSGYTKRAFIVSPTYFLATKIFEDAGFAHIMTPIRSLDHTIDFPSLLSHLSHISSTTPDVPLSEGLKPIVSSTGKRREKRIYKYVLYCVPTYSNPTGQTWDLATRQRLVEIAREWDILLVSDDVYDFLGNLGDRDSRDENGKLLPRLVSIDREIVLKERARKEKNKEKSGTEAEETGYTVSNCSFSKLLGPGLRCGWVESATGVLAKQLGEGGANHSHLTKTYTIRCNALISALQSKLPTGTKISGGRGGFFIWLQFPESYDARAIIALAAEKTEVSEGVIVASGEMSECPGEGNSLGWGERCVRISISWCEVEEALEGVERLRMAVERWEKGERAKGVRDIEVK
ncbi:Valine--pyruvate aminotransferase [Rhizina undulata]